MIKNKIITIILVAFSVMTNAQNSFKAKVLDSESNEFLTGANLLLKGTNNRVITDANGLGTLKNIPNGSQTIVITFMGYDKNMIRVFWGDIGSIIFIDNPHE